MESQHYTSIDKLSGLIRERKVSASDLVNTCLQRIEKFNPKLNAFITILHDFAIEQAKVADDEIKAGKWRGPLHGIPIGIKDFYDTAGIKTTAAFEHFKDRVPRKDAHGVARLKNAGAILIGKTNMHQLGMGTTGLESYFGPVHNPWNDEYIAGGSSSGSAAAVASGMCYATLDTDAIGSCRLPAACCGVIGFKGTYGLISPQGILDGEQPPDEMIRWFGHPGVTTRKVEDTALVLNVLAERNNVNNSVDFSEELGKVRQLQIGVTDNFEADNQVKQALDKAVNILQRWGYVVKTTTPPFGFPHDSLQNIEADRKSITQNAFGAFDCILLPTTATIVPLIKKTNGNPQGLSPQNTIFANYYGLPAITMPCGFDRNGLPLAVQIVGKPWHDADVLYLARQFSESTEFGKEHPFI